MATLQDAEELQKTPPSVSTEQAHPTSIEVWQNRFTLCSHNKAYVDNAYSVRNRRHQSILAEHKVALLRILATPEERQKLVQQDLYIYVHDFISAALTIINIAEIMTVSLESSHLYNFLYRQKTNPHTVRKLDKVKLFDAMTEFSFATINVSSLEQSQEKSEFFLRNGLETLLTNKQILFLRERLQQLTRFERTAQTVNDDTTRFAMVTQAKLKALALSATLGIASNIPAELQNWKCITLLLASFNVFENFR